MIAFLEAHYDDLYFLAMFTVVLVTVVWKPVKVTITTNVFNAPPREEG